MLLAVKIFCRRLIVFAYFHFCVCLTERLKNRKYSLLISWFQNKPFTGFWKLGARYSQLSLNGYLCKTDKFCRSGFTVLKVFIKRTDSYAKRVIPSSKGRTRKWYTVRRHIWDKEVPPPPPRPKLVQLRLTLFSMGGIMAPLKFFLNISGTTWAKTIKLSDFKFLPLGCQKSINMLFLDFTCYHGYHFVVSTFD